MGLQIKIICFLDYNVFSSGTQPNVAYEAGAGMRLQGANNDEEAGRSQCMHAQNALWLCIIPT